MRIFLTGATGFIGSALVPELIGAGHQVLGMTRSASGAATLKAAGAEVHYAELEDLDSIRTGAALADGVIHCAFDHDFTNFVANCEKDRRVIEALGQALAGSDRHLVITSGTGIGSPGPGLLATEDVYNANYPHPRIASEQAGEAVQAAGGKVSVVRLPQVHNTFKQGLVTPWIEIARQKGTMAYVGEGSNRFAAAHVSDVARLYRLVFEKQQTGSRYHAVDEEGVVAREIAEVLGAKLNLPVVSVSTEEAPAQLGWMSMFAGFDLPASGKWTQQELDWHPTGPGLLADLKQLST